MTGKTIVQRALSTLDHKVDDSEVLPESDEVSSSGLMMYAFRSSPVGVVYEGEDTEECRQALHEDLYQRGCIQQAIQELMEFTGRSRRAVTRWIKGEAMPQRVDWLKWQYWLRAKGYYTKELDGMPRLFFQLRKHLIVGDVSFVQATTVLRLETQGTLWALLNNEISLADVEDREWVALTIGRIYRLIQDINSELTAREIAGYLEVDLDPDGEFAEIKHRYGIGKNSRILPDEQDKLVPRM